MKGSRIFTIPLFLSMGYLLFRMGSKLFGLEYSIALFRKFPVFFLLIALSVVLFWIASKKYRETGSRIETFKSTARVGLLTAVFSGLGVWLYYVAIDTTYLPNLIADRIDEARSLNHSAEDLLKYRENLEVLNSPRMRSVFTTFGLTLYSFAHAGIFSLLNGMKGRR
jgi:hypothetical protein